MHRKIGLKYCWGFLNFAEASWCYCSINEVIMIVRKLFLEWSEWARPLYCKCKYSTIVPYSAERKGNKLIIFQHFFYFICRHTINFKPLHIASLCQRKPNCILPPPWVSNLGWPLLSTDQFPCLSVQLFPSRTKALPCSCSLAERRWLGLRPTSSTNTYSMNSDGYLGQKKRLVSHQSCTCPCKTRYNLGLRLKHCSKTENRDEQ